MKTYTIETTWSEFIQEFNSEAKDKLQLPAAAVHKLFGSCSVTEIKTTDKDVFVALQFSDTVKKFSLLWLVDHTQLVLVDRPDTLLTEISDVFKASYFEHEADLKRQAEQERLAKLEAVKNAKKEAAEKKKAEAFEKKKAKDITDFEAQLTRVRPISTSSEFYYSLGWLTRHVGTVSAAFPDYLKDSFVRQFGPDVPYRSVDSKKVGPSGYTSQWRRSCQVSLKKPEGIPAYLAQHLNPMGNALTDTDFVLDLVENYGFKFGKSQSLETIKSCIPVTYLQDFENGRGPDPEPKIKKSRKTKVVA